MGEADPNHDCGTLRYVRVEYAGAEFQPNNEINAVTFGGCGKGTVVDHVQARYGLDDMFEWFGGTMDAKYLVGSYARDDFIDTQIGWTGASSTSWESQERMCPATVVLSSTITRVISPLVRLTSPPYLTQRLLELATHSPRALTKGTGVAGAWLRRGTGGSFNNTILFNWISNGFTIRDAATVAAASARRSHGRRPSDVGQRQGLWQSQHIGGSDVGSRQSGLAYSPGTTGKKNFDCQPSSSGVLLS